MYIQDEYSIIKDEYTINGFPYLEKKIIKNKHITHKQKPPKI